MTTTQTTEATWIAPFSGKAHLAHANKWGWALECSGRTISYAAPIDSPNECEGGVCKRCAAKVVAPEVTAGDVQQMLTDRQIPCPDCSQPMLGARVFDTQAQEAFIGVACRGCDKAYRV